jgi:hypothetical protein
VKRTTTIRINGERWNVPRGFGEAYKREAAGQIGRPPARARRGDRGLIDLMLLIGYAPTREAVRDWPLRKRVEAVVYAANVHPRERQPARHPERSNPIQRHPRAAVAAEAVAGQSRAPVREQTRGRHVGRQHLRCLVDPEATPDDLVYAGRDGDTRPGVVHTIRWYARGRS